MRAALCSLMALGLTACATDKAYYDAIEARTRAEQTVAVARAEADKARFAAIAAMGNAGGDAAKVAAMFSLMQQPGSVAVQAPAAPIAPAPSPVDRVLQVLQLTNNIVTPWIAPVMAYKQSQVNGNVAVAQANANRDIFLGSYNALAQVAGNIPQPTTTTTTNNTTTNTTTANQTTTTANQTTTTANQTTTNSVGRDGVIGAGTLTRTCSAGAGAAGSAGAAGGYSVSSPSLAASGVPGNSLATGGAGGAGAPGGAGGALNC
jgi:hypothetical protein